MNISKSFYAKTADGQDIFKFKLENASGSYVEIINFGGVILTINVPDKEGTLTDVNLGFDSLPKYEEKNPFFGALVGRFANRIENAEFELNGATYSLAKNNGNNHLHGGNKGFDKAVWAPSIVETSDGEVLELTYLSKDGEENYPGNLAVKVIYSFTDDNQLKIAYEATTDKDTIINLTNHSYFNLSGHASGTICDHILKINAHFATANNSESIPTGEIYAVKSTPMDFTEGKPIGRDIDANFEQVRFAGGYDHNWIIDKAALYPAMAAEVYDPKSGRTMEVYTTKPGVQLYTANMMSTETKGKGDLAYGPRCAFCLETQFFPNGVKYTHFPSCVLKAGEEYKHLTIYKFGVR